MQRVMGKFKPTFFLMPILLLFAPALLIGQEIKIKQEKGVTVVYNPKDPAPTPDTLSQFVLTEELVIHDMDDSGRQLYTEPWGLKADEEGNIYILDFKLGRVCMLNPEGDFIRFIGRKGEGPGELSSPSRMDMYKKNAIMAYDTTGHKVSIFNKNGEFIRKFTTAEYGSIYYVRCDSQGRFIAAHQTYNQENRTYELKLYNQEFKSELELCTWSIKRDPPRTWNPIATGPLRYYLMPDDKIIWGSGDKYTLHIIDHTGKLERKIIKDNQALKVTSADKKKYTKENKYVTDRGYKLIFPDQYPSFQYFLADDQGRIFVQTWERNPDDEGWLYDVFDRSGRYVARIPLRIKPWCIRNGKMYVIDHDKEELPVIRCFKVEWK